MWLPKWLYELFPYVALLIGAVAAAHHHNLLMSVCGAMLILSGIIIVKMRYDYRTIQRDVRQRELECDIAQERQAQRALARAKQP